MSTIQLLYFAQAAKLTGCAQEECPLDAAISVGDLRDRVLGRHPGLRPLAATLRWAVDETMADDDTAVHPGQTVAVMPPFSGG